jgi:hypothetical protein
MPSLASAARADHRDENRGGRHEQRNPGYEHEDDPVNWNVLRTQGRESSSRWR